MSTLDQIFFYYVSLKKKPVYKTREPGAGNMRTTPTEQEYDAVISHGLTR